MWHPISFTFAAVSTIFTLTTQLHIAMRGFGSQDVTTVILCS
jgi:hypothetical protein